jgi:hypothetical protein
MLTTPRAIKDFDFPTLMASSELTVVNYVSLIAR